MRIQRQKKFRPRNARLQSQGSVPRQKRANSRQGITGICQWMTGKKKCVWPAREWLGHKWLCTVHAERLRQIRIANHAKKFLRELSKGQGCPTCDK